MPDQPFPKREPLHGLERTPHPARDAAPEFAELHCRSNFSFLEGASHPDELVGRAAELGLTAIAITDLNSLAGVVRAHVACKESGLRLIVGAELELICGLRLLVWCQDRTGYGRLSRLITKGRRRSKKGECRLELADIADLGSGVLVGVRFLETAQASVPELSRFLKSRLFAVLEPQYDGRDENRWLNELAIAERYGLTPVVANNVYFHVAERQPLQDVLAGIRLGCTVDELGHRRLAHGQFYLKSRSEMAQLFRSAPEAVANVSRILETCTFSLDELKYEYPDEPCPEGRTPAEHLAELTWRGAAKRYPTGIPEHVDQLIRYELKLIRELNYEPYFLTVWDVVRFARSRGILCQGRGSAANSAVCVCLGITSVDPERIDVLFERFVSKERDEAPDIDVDFEHERREEVLQYLYSKYGRDRAGMTAVVITYRARSAVRDVGKALGLSIDRVDQLARQVDNYGGQDSLAPRFADAGFDPTRGIGRMMLGLVREILGFPRHLSQHVGGMVMTRGDLCDLVPIENAAMNQDDAIRHQRFEPGTDRLAVDRTVIQWDKDDLDALGILKVDCLCLGMLSAIRKCFGLLRNHYGRDLNLATVPSEDPRVYQMIQKADTIGLFQIESRAQMSMLPRLKPACFYDLVIEVAIVRPGPIQGDMVHPYLKRRRGEEPVEFPDERVRDVLHKTLGVPIFQEQAMRLAVVAAGFSPGEADQLRRAMGAWRKAGVIDKFRVKLIEGMQANGYDVEFAERVFKQIRGFGEYGFPESHAASFALLVYVSAWLKKYYPEAFVCSIVNSQPMGFYAPAQLIADARKHGVEVRPVDVNASHWDCTLEPREKRSDCAIRLGFRMVRGFKVSDYDRIEAIRTQSAFESLADFTSRTGASNTLLSALARADAFRSLSIGRRNALWTALPEGPKGPLLDREPLEQAPEELPDMTGFDEVVADYRTVGLSLKGHPFRYLRDQLRERKVIRAGMLESTVAGQRIHVAGLVLLRQRPSTASGITFVTLEDETGFTNLIIRPDVWEKFRNVARSAQAMVATGILQKQDGVIHVLVDRLDDITDWLRDARVASRDFR